MTSLVDVFHNTLTPPPAMDIDKMFKLPPTAASGLGAKRKLPDLPTEEVLKRFRQDSSVTGSRDSRVVTVEDAVEVEEGVFLHVF